MIAIGLLLGAVCVLPVDGQPRPGAASEPDALRQMEVLAGRQGRWARPAGGSAALSQEERLADLVTLTLLFEHTLPVLLAGNPAGAHLYLQVAADGARYLDHADPYLALDPALHRQGALAYRAVGDFQRALWQARAGPAGGAVASYRRAGHMLRALSASRADDRLLASELSLVGTGLESLGVRPLLIIGPEGLRRHEYPSGPGYANPSPVPEPQPAATPRNCAGPDYDMAAWALPAPPEEMDEARLPEWNELEGDFCRAASRIDAARTSVEDLAARLAAIGQQPRAELISNASTSELVLMDAYHAMEDGDLTAARRDIARARDIASRVLKQLGG